MLAGLSIFIVLLFLGMGQQVIIASIGATAFVVFALPNNLTAGARNVIGGHTAGLLCGFAGSHLAGLPGQDAPVLIVAAYAVSVCTAIFLMVVFDVEHPPAAGTALGVAVQGFTLKIAISVILIVIVLSGIKFIFRKYLRDLT